MTYVGLSGDVCMGAMFPVGEVVSSGAVFLVTVSNFEPNTRCETGVLNTFVTRKLDSGSDLLGTSAACQRKGTKMSGHPQASELGISACNFIDCGSQAKCGGYAEP